MRTEVPQVETIKQIPLFADLNNLPPQIHEVGKSTGYVELQHAKSGSTTEKIVVSHGFHPFGTPPGYKGELGAFYVDVDQSQPIQFIKERFHLEGDSDVVLGTQGSNEILERIAMSFRDKTRIIGVGPHFTGFKQSIDIARHSDYSNFSPPLTYTASETIDALMRSIPSEEALLTEIEKNGSLDEIVPSAIYISNPDAKGDFIDKQKMRTFIEKVTSLGVMVIVDEALGDFLPDDQSAADLTKDNSHIIVVRSFSKAIGIPGDGLAYMIAHKSYTDEYRNQMRDHHYRGDNRLLFNEMTEPGLFYSTLEDVRNKTQAYKSILLETLEEYGIAYLPTNPSTPIVFIDGMEEGFYDALDLEATSGAGFTATHTNGGSDQISSRYVRIGLPFVDFDDPNATESFTEECRKISKKIKAAIHIVEEFNRHKYNSI